MVWAWGAKIALVPDKGRKKIPGKELELLCIQYVSLYY